MIIRDLEQRFRSLVLDYDGYTADDNTISARSIYQMLLQARSRYYKQKKQNRQRFSPISIQPLDCVKLVSTDRSECPSTPISGCTWQKSVKALPTPIEIVTVTDDTGEVQFEFIPWNKCKSISTKRIKSARKGKYFTLKQTKSGLGLFVMNDLFLENVSVGMIAEDPLEAINFCDPTAECEPLEQEFHTTESEIEVILKLAVDMYVRLAQLRQANRDEQNNDKKD